MTAPCDNNAHLLLPVVPPVNIMTQGVFAVQSRIGSVLPLTEVTSISGRVSFALTASVFSASAGS